MNKKAILQRLFSSLLAATLLFGVLHLTTEPAEAGFQCPPRLFGNTFSHVETTYLPSGLAICTCIYETPSGGEVPGPGYYC